MFNAQTTDIANDRVIKYQLTRNNSAISYLQVLTLWRGDQAFRSFFTSVLRTSPYEAFRWETPPLSRITESDPFEFVLLNANTFTKRIADAATYSEHFTNDDEGVVTFDNLGGDATLIVPSPRTSHEAYGHLAAFVRTAPTEQIHALWRVVGRTADSRISSDPLWLNTAGGGVAWLHVRLDSHPKYYGHSEYSTYPTAS